MLKKIVIFALVLICVFAALSFAATDSGDVAVVVAGTIAAIISGIGGDDSEGLRYSRIRS